MVVVWGWSFVLAEIELFWKNSEIFGEKCFLRSLEGSGGRLNKLGSVAAVEVCTVLVCNWCRKQSCSLDRWEWKWAGRYFSWSQANGYNTGNGVTIGVRCLTYMCKGRVGVSSYLRNNSGWSQKHSFYFVNLTPANFVRNHSGYELCMGWNANLSVHLICPRMFASVAA